MAHDDYPRGGGLGVDTNPKRPAQLDPEWIMAYGSRGQRREIRRQIQAAARRGDPGAAELLTELTGRIKGSR